MPDDVNVLKFAYGTLANMNEAYDPGNFMKKAERLIASIK